MTENLNHLWMNDYLPTIWPTYGISWSFSICRCCCGPGDWVKWFCKPTYIMSIRIYIYKYWWSTGMLERV